MSRIRRFDHVGITVADLDTATAFFVGLGLEVEGNRMLVEGEFLDTVIGIPDARTEIVMLRSPDGGLRWSCRNSSGPTLSRDPPSRWPTNWGCGTWRSRWTTSRWSSTGWPRMATAWSAASVTTSTHGAWPT
jgi:catechol 2,3-dioxygenase-like lactoylglutathione lyase family enzyme